MKKAINEYFPTETPTRSKTPQRTRTSPDLDLTAVEKPAKKGSALEKNMESDSKSDISLKNLFDYIKQMDSKFDAKFTSVATKTDINNLKKQIKDLREENQQLREEVKLVQEKQKANERKLDMMDNKLRRNYLIFKGLSKENETNYAETIRGFCKEVLKIETPIYINKAFKIGPQNSKFNLILASFSNQSEVTQILQNRKKLKGTGYVIQEDLAENTRKRRNKILAIRKEILKLNKSTKLTIRWDYTVVEGVRFD
jgi:regulator of replication initiation timing